MGRVASGAEDPGLLGFELVLGENALLPELREVLELFDPVGLRSLRRWGLFVSCEQVMVTWIAGSTSQASPRAA